MQNRYLIIFLTGVIFVCLFVLGGCNRATSTELSPGSGTSTQNTTLEGSITPNSTEAYPQLTEEIHPFPTIPVQPTLTVQAYPQPLIEISSPHPEPSQITGYPNPPVVASSTTNPAGLVTATTEPTQLPEATETEIPETSTPTRTATEVSAYPGLGGDATEPYPAPQFIATGPYPGPEITETQTPYKGPVTNTPRPSQLPARSPTLTESAPGTITPIPTSEARTPEHSPTEIPPRPPLSPPPVGSSVTIWHSWGTAETGMLQTVIEAFRRSNPDVTFNLQYIPTDDLYNAYYDAAYFGQGPSLLFGPAEWGPELFDEGLISDLNPFIPFGFLSDINPPALSSGEYHKSLISLPLSQHGMVMFRNTSIISTAPQSIEELISSSKEATRAGIVGSYLERGSYFSAANILGLGGGLMDEDEYPTFNDSFGLAWLYLLTDYDTAGAVTFNTNRDLDMFKRKRVGIIIDGTWNIDLLTQIIGAENLAIDPWLSYGSGHLSGWVEADSVFLNINISDADRFAVLSFIGYLLDPNVQVRLAEVGHIPSVVTAIPRDRLLQQALQAFSLGVPFPITVDNNILSLYWKYLDIAIQDIYNRNISPSSALTNASNAITQSINKITNQP